MVDVFFPTVMRKPRVFHPFCPGTPPVMILKQNPVTVGSAGAALDALVETADEATEDATEEAAEDAAEETAKDTADDDTGALETLAEDAIEEDGNEEIAEEGIADDDATNSDETEDGFSLHPAEAMPTRAGSNQSRSRMVEDLERVQTSGIH